MGMLLVGIGGLLCFVGWIWLIITAFSKAGAVWGILAIFFSWIAGLIMHFTKSVGLQPTLLIIGGFVLVIIGQMIGN
jgi:hypothetical protein